MTQEFNLQNTTEQQPVAQGLLMLIVPPSLEEMLVDELLQSVVSGFTSSKVNGHSTVHGDAEMDLSIVEQVTGRQQRVQFMMHASVADLKNLVLTLKARFKAKDIQYILLPILEC